jgi:thiosulfate dehydrogenase
MTNSIFSGRRSIRGAVTMVALALALFILPGPAPAHGPGIQGPGQGVGPGMAPGMGQMGMGPGMMMGRLRDPATLKTTWPKNKKLFDSLALGGQGYDNWAKLQGKKLPAKTHFAYPATGKRKGATTSRCKECHGWDYEGVKGAYAKGSHYSGIKGIAGAQGRAPQSIAKMLRGGLHGYTKAMIPDDLLADIALFVSRGQVNAKAFIDYGTAKARGSASNGHHDFQHRCAECHGSTGKAINFGSKKKPEYVGTVARKAPWEALHKMRVGHPGSIMPSLRGLGDRRLADILAYTQTLPAK